MSHKLWLINDEWAHDKVIYPSIKWLTSWKTTVNKTGLFFRDIKVSLEYCIFSLIMKKYASFHEMNAQFWLDHDITHSLEESLTLQNLVRPDKSGYDRPARPGTYVRSRSMSVSAVWMSGFFSLSRFSWVLIGPLIRTSDWWKTWLVRINAVEQSL